MNDSLTPVIDDQSTRALRKSTDGAAVIAAASALPAPKRQLAGYELGEQIGAGGMGAVFCATHRMLGRTVAVKFISADVLADPQAVARFTHEMRTIGKLDHANIVRATDAGCEQGVHYLVTEFVDGADAAQLVYRHGPLPLADACEIIRQAALGLDHAQQCQLVHRDVKPSNLRIDRQGVVKLLDFGIARMTAGQTTLTATGQVIGTLDFVAPEQVNDARFVDIRADIYSLGCTFLFLLTGKPPFSGPAYDSPGSKIKGHLMDPPPDLQRIANRLPAAVARLLTRMMAKDPGQRFRTPAEVAEALLPHARSSNLKSLVSATASPLKRDPASQGSSVWPVVRSCVRGAGPLVSRLFFGRQRVYTGHTNLPQPTRSEPLVSVGGILFMVIVGFLLTQIVSCTPINGGHGTAISIFGQRVLETYKQ